MTGKRILVCPLDWGLGHATRCIPLIEQLLKEGAEVIIAADQAPLKVLQETFPELEWVSFPGLEIRYPKSGNMALYIASLMPALWKMAKQEHAQIEAWVKSLQLDGVLSDNRYGAFSYSVPSVFMTHQLFIKGSKYMEWTEPIIGMLNRYMIQKFDACWVPDYAGENNLSGDLAHGKPLPFPETYYLGPLSRFRTDANATPIPESDEILVMLSGPEPQRSMLEESMRQQLKNNNRKALIVRGKPGDAEIPDYGNVRSVSHLNSDHLEKAIRSASFIVCRAGYSTLMDLHALGRPALIIPTPGQTEQEYLGRRCHAKGWHIHMLQDQLQLEAGIQALAQLPKSNFMHQDNTLPLLGPIFPNSKRD